MQNKPVCFSGIAMHPAARARLEEVYEVTESEDRLGEAEAALCYGFPDAWADRARMPRLRAIGCHSCGETVPAWAEAEGVQLALAESLWRTVAEHTLALMLAAARKVVPADRAVREGRWTEHVHIKETYSGCDFQNRTIGILGMGQIGRELADMLRGFKMDVRYYDIRKLSEEEARALQVQYRPLDALLSESDYFCVLVPLDETTRGMIGENEFGRLKKGCIFVNTARAGIVDEAAFLAALEDGTIGAAALDVFWDEACVQKDALTRRDNVVLSPHLGGSTYECDLSLVETVCSVQKK